MKARASLCSVQKFDPVKSFTDFRNKGDAGLAAIVTTAFFVICVKRFLAIQRQIEAKLEQETKVNALVTPRITANQK